jgi:hypothetical protein
MSFSDNKRLFQRLRLSKTVHGYRKYFIPSPVKRLFIQHGAGVRAFPTPDSLLPTPRSEATLTLRCGSDSSPPVSPKAARGPPVKQRNPEKE